MNTQRQELIDHDALEWFGFSRVGNDDLEWKHAWLMPRNMELHYFDQAYHFIVRNTCQGIGAMRTIDELVKGFEFVTGYFDGKKSVGINLYRQP